MKRVLVAPLDWGLGHATRCIPVIREFLNRSWEVFIAGSGDSLSLLKAEFPSLKFFTLPAYNPVYPSQGGSMVWKMVFQIPRFFKVIREEHAATEKLIKEYNINLVVSDNRYGCWSSSVPCVFITHQSNIMMPRRFGWLASIVRRMNEAYMKRFTQCWLPDYPEEHSLSGALIAFGKKDKQVKFVHVGHLSRFKPSGNTEKKYDVVAILSGPEPQRTILENIVFPQLQRSGLKYFAVRGSFTPATLVDPNSVDFLTTEALQQVIESSAIVLARSGYSTVMDMAALEKKVIFIPTPGQTEQEYLAQRMMEKGIAFYMEQRRFDLVYVLSKTEQFSGFPAFISGDDLLSRAIDELVL